jgi:hypothetical protein
LLLISSNILLYSLSIYRREVLGAFFLWSVGVSITFREGLSALEEGVLSSLWKSLAPSKVVAFSWALLLDRIPTRVNLAFQHILNQEVPLTCVLCGQTEESSIHLFLHCKVVSKIWRGVLNWQDMNFITPQNLYVQFEC